MLPFLALLVLAELGEVRASCGVKIGAAAIALETLCFFLFSTRRLR